MDRPGRAMLEKVLRATMACISRRMRCSGVSRFPSFAMTTIMANSNVAFRAARRPQLTRGRVREA
jgi:hypothetical protein